MIKYLIYIFFSMFILTHCSFSSNLEKDFMKIKNLNILKTKKNITLLNFSSATKNIISELLNSKSILITYKTSFFINLLRNDSNMILNSKALTDIIKKNIINSTNKIDFFDINNINKNKFESLDLKRSIKNSTVILLSRNNHVKYCLNSCISGEKNPFLLKIQIILVKTGEIVFSKIEKFYC